MSHLENFILFLRSVLGIGNLHTTSQQDVLMPIKVQHDDMDMRRNVTERCAAARRHMYDDDY